MRIVALSFASDLIANHAAELQRRQRFEEACQMAVEVDFLKRLSEHLNCSYADSERAFEQLGPNIHGLVNSPHGRCVLAHALTGDGAPLFISAIN